MKESIDESDMRFGPFPDGYCFHIEKNATLSGLGKDAPKSAEFLLIWPFERSRAPVWIIEAKKSSPRSDPNLGKYLSDIKEKFVNSLALVLAMLLGRHGDAALSGLPEPFRSLDLKTADFRFLLVINGHREDWLPPLQDALRKELKVFAKILALGPNSVSVVNDTWAREKHLIS